MASTWRGKACAICGGRKGPAFRDKKHCGRCAPAAKRAASEAAYAAHILDTYGITFEDYTRLYVAQGGACAICKRATGKRRRLAVDHNHKTGEVRGLLCKICNGMLGHARDDPAFFMRAITYLAHPPWRTLNESSGASGEAGGRAA